jgi:hypothetical protein
MHTCRPPYVARILGCDCSRCCAAAPHEPDCTSPDDTDYHLDECPACND